VLPGFLFAALGSDKWALLQYPREGIDGVVESIDQSKFGDFVASHRAVEMGDLLMGKLNRPNISQFLTEMESNWSRPVPKAVDVVPRQLVWAYHPHPN